LEKFFSDNKRLEKERETL